MAFVDELTIRAKAGNGGDGVVRWLHLKGKEYSGPAGGNGGDGGNVYVRGVRDIGLLARYRGEKMFKAESGAAGQSASMHGRRGTDLYIDLPVGSVIVNQETGERYELLAEGETKLVLKGGRGGAGNEVFKSSVNRRPQESLPGGRGEEAELKIELRLIADAGLVGLPNAGKTSLLNTLTGASAKVGSYAFTTLDPNLGVLYGFVLADIPGLIEGASEGKGLGFKFLRHIARTRLILHCVSLELDDPLSVYKTVRDELSRFDDGSLAKKPELVILTKSDTRTQGEVKKVIQAFKKRGCEVTTVTILDDLSVKALQEAVVQALR
ncbi:MAG: GTPase ObgE [Patescibacteria group bacterium]|nr:GTPase ObgE [Patescibacteria group bacterium]